MHQYTRQHNKNDCVFLLLLFPLPFTPQRQMKWKIEAKFRTYHPGKNKEGLGKMSGVSFSCQTQESIADILLTGGTPPWSEKLQVRWQKPQQWNRTPLTCTSGGLIILANWNAIINTQNDYCLQKNISACAEKLDSWVSFSMSSDIRFFSNIFCNLR